MSNWPPDRDEEPIRQHPSSLGLSRVQAARWTPPPTPVVLYLRSRGLTDDEILAFARGDPMLPDYAVFPYGPLGVEFPLGWTARRICEGEPRYRSGAKRDGWQPEALPWGLWRVKKGSPVYVCEGIFDAIHFGTGVAVLSGKVYEAQAKCILVMRPSKVVIACDDDAKLHIEGAADLFRELDRYTEVEEIYPPEGYKDFGELLAKGVRHGA